jgi:hypothetical protein
VVSLTPRGKEPPVPIGKKARRAPKPVWTTWGRENSFPYRDTISDLSVVQSVASRYTDSYSYLIPHNNVNGKLQSRTLKIRNEEIATARLDRNKMYVFIKQGSRSNYFPIIYILLNGSHISIRKLFQINVADHTVCLSAAVRQHTPWSRR